MDVMGEDKKVPKAVRHLFVFVTRLHNFHHNGDCASSCPCLPQSQFGEVKILVSVVGGIPRLGSQPWFVTNEHTITILMAV